MSLDADPNGDDEQQSGLGDYLPDPRSDDVERGIAEQEMRELIAHRLAELPEKEQLVLVLYYYEELTLKEIGEILDVTESRVCQIHTKAILRLKGKIDRHEGKTSIGRLTSEIQQRRPSILDPLAVKVNIMAGLAAGAAGVAGGPAYCPALPPSRTGAAGGSVVAGGGVSLQTTIVQLGSVAQTQLKGQQAHHPTTPFSERLDANQDATVQRVRKADEAERKRIDADAKRERRAAGARGGRGGAGSDRGGGGCGGNRA